MAQQRLLVISVSAGSGHVRAAQALLETSTQFNAKFSDDFSDESGNKFSKKLSNLEAEHIDVMTYVGRSFRGAYSDFYRHLIRHAPAVWAYLYQKTDNEDRSDISSILRRTVERICTKKLIKKINDFKPDQIICTHFLPADLLSREISKGRLHCPVWVQVTDFDLHSLWVQPYITGYFAANAEVNYKLRERGVDANAIHTTGIAVSPVFSETRNKKTCQRELGLQLDLPTALILCGGSRIGTVTDIAQRLLQNNDRLQVIALAGNNQAQLTELQKLAEQFPGRLVPLLFSKTIENLMAASDVVITKPGGLTSSECLIMGLPMVLVDPIPGQEERNGDYLMEHGAAVKAHDIVGLDYKITQLIADPDRLMAMRQAMLRLGKPDAAYQVLTKVLAQVHYDELSDALIDARTDAPTDVPLHAMGE